jgi:hypothetical protein
MFLLLGPQNYQWHLAGVERIGYISITVVPNNENRASNIFYKYADAQGAAVNLRNPIGKIAPNPSMKSLAISYRLFR